MGTPGNAGANAICALVASFGDRRSWGWTITTAHFTPQSLITAAWNFMCASDAEQIVRDDSSEVRLARYSRNAVFMSVKCLFYFSPQRSRASRRVAAQFKTTLIECLSLFFAARPRRKRPSGATVHPMIGWI